VVALLALALTGCVFDRITLPVTDSQVVVHGVLNSGTRDQVVLLERSLGTGTIVRLPYDTLDPIVSDGGTPVSGARVVVRNARGDSVLLREDRSWRPAGRGGGVYRFLNDALPPVAGEPVPHFLITPGERYDLRVTTTDGAVITASTVVPRTDGSITVVAPRQFFRERDSIFLGWPAVPLAARYELRVESANGPFTTFVDSLEYLVSGSLTHRDQAGRPNVFWPGLRQVITVSAVDANYFDYYRSGSDAISGRGLIMHVTGGLGLFGSMARVRERTVDVRTEQGPEPAGRWELVSPLAGTALPRTFELWPESQTVGAERLSGAVTGYTGSGDPPAVVLTRYGASASLVVLVQQSLRDTLAAVTGQFEGNVASRFTGTLKGSGQTVTYRRVP
jgi:hypothetical protein